jgi:hypothetical protein
MNDIADARGRRAAGLSLAAVPPAAQRQALRRIASLRERPSATLWFD